MFKEKLKQTLEQHPRYFWVITVILILGAWFYWFQWRPMEIRKECSRIERHTDPVPELTQAQIDQEATDYNACIAAHPNTTTGASIIDNLPYNCGFPHVGDKPHPAIPASTYYDPAPASYYSSCIHSHGL